MLNTFDLLGNNENDVEINELSKMADNNTSVDLPAIVNRLNALEQIVQAMQTAQTANRPINGTEIEDNNGTVDNATDAEEDNNDS